MKKLFLFLFLTICTISYAQIVPSRMSYQAVIRNASNNLVVSSPVGMRISILQGSATGPTVYVETHTPSTNANGLISIEVGAGTPVSGIFSAINWAGGPYFIKTETDPTGGTSYSIFSTSPFNSVPYAFMAERANYLGQDSYDVYGTGQLVVSSSTTAYTLIPGLSQTLNIGAGYKVYVKTDGGLQCTATGNAFSVVDITLFVDGVASTQAGSRRIVAANTAGIAQVISNWSFGKGYSLTPGMHTFEVKAVYAGAGASTANVSSSSAPQLQGVLTVMLIKQ